MKSRKLSTAEEKELLYKAFKEDVVRWRTSETKDQKEIRELSAVLGLQRLLSVMDDEIKELKLKVIRLEQNRFFT